MLVLQERVWCCIRSDETKRHKKTARLGWRFFGKLGFNTNDSPLSIRQRLEMPKKVEIKLGGHEDLVVW
ncbi:hypothetical protein ASG35_29495 [Burkholderia sp. Leaf177]|nr:hypothetical protein ASG35_29495 [Burkholderia sp. Leaf177]